MTLSTSRLTSPSGPISPQPVSAPLVSSRRRKKATGHIKLRIGFVPAPAPAESGLPAMDYQSVYAYLLKRSQERNILTVPAFQGIGTMLEGESGDDDSADELQDDGISSSSSDDDDDDDSPPSAPASPSAKPRDLPALVPQTSADGLLLPALGPALLGVPSLGSSTTTLDQPSSASSALPTPRRLSFPGSSKKDKKGKGSGDDYFDLSAAGPSSGAVTPAEPAAAKKSRAPKFKRKEADKDWSYSTDSEILGVVLLEIKGAEDLPRLKNVLKIGCVLPSLRCATDVRLTLCCLRACRSFDMDPFVVVSFGKKIFRTRVIRHELNPQWNEKLLFHCKKYERCVRASECSARCGSRSC